LVGDRSWAPVIHWGRSPTGIVRIDPQSGVRSSYRELGSVTCPGGATPTGSHGFAFGENGGVYVILTGTNGFAGVGQYCPAGIVFAPATWLAT
jgi:hypothetical protein